MTLKEQVNKIVEDYEKMTPQEIAKESESWLEVLRVCDNNDPEDIKGYIITLTYGGPNIYLDTCQDCVRGFWGSDSYTCPLSDNVGDTIADFLYGESIEKG